MPPEAQAQDAIGIGGHVLCPVSGITMGRKVQVCAEGRDLSRALLGTDQRDKGKRIGQRKWTLVQYVDPRSL